MFSAVVLIGKKSRLSWESRRMGAYRHTKPNGHTIPEMNRVTVQWERVIVYQESCDSRLLQSKRPFLGPTCRLRRAGRVRAQPGLVRGNSGGREGNTGGALESSLQMLYSADSFSNNCGRFKRISSASSLASLLLHLSNERLSFSPASVLDMYSGFLIGYLVPSNYCCHQFHLWHNSSTLGCRFPFGYSCFMHVYELRNRL